MFARKELEQSTLKLILMSEEKVESILKLGDLNTIEIQFNQSRPYDTCMHQQYVYLKYHEGQYLVKHS